MLKTWKNKCSQSALTHSPGSHTTCTPQWFTISHEAQRAEVLLFLLILSENPDQQKPLLWGKFNIYKLKQLHQETVGAATKTSCLVVKIPILSFRNSAWAIPSGWFWTWGLRLAPSPMAFPINRLLMTVRPALLLSLPRHFVQKFHPEHKKPFLVKATSKLETI